MEKLRPVNAAPSLTDYVASTLRDAITSLQLAPGTPIVEASLARQLGVSTTPVREALHRLAKDGLVVLNRFRGATVVTMSAQDVVEISQLREVLEPLTVRLAVPHFTEDDIAGVAALLRQSGEAIARQDWAELSRRNRDFHGSFFSRCGNERLRSILENLQDQNRIIALLTWHNRGHQSQEHEEHLAILDALQRRDAEGAAACAYRHVRRFGQSIVEAWSGFETRAAAASFD
jgi:DNA-binding GntR family transcriptional regulator